MSSSLLLRYGWLLVLPLLAVRCPREKTDDPKPLTPLEQLPPATMEGKDTFGCLINGQPWSSQQPNLVRLFVTADWTVNDALFIMMQNMTEVEGLRSYRTIRFALPDSTRLRSLQSGTYLLSSDSTGNHVQYEAPPKQYLYHTLKAGNLTLTRLDRQARICSGTFEFTMVGAPGDTVRVTHGRFDISRLAL